MIITEIKAMLDLFQGKVPDKDSNRLVRQFCDEKHKWVKAHGLFGTIRDRNLAAAKKGDAVHECQYCFEEVVAKTLYNLAKSGAPFDADSPYWVIKNALSLARAIGISDAEVLAIIAPNKALERDAASRRPSA